MSHKLTRGKLANIYKTVVRHRVNTEEKSEEKNISTNLSVKTTLEGLLQYSVRQLKKKNQGYVVHTFQCESPGWNTEYN